jgi:hypothetical protein
MLSDSVPPYYTDGRIGKKSRRNEDFLPADAYLNSTRHVRGQDYLPHPKLIVVWSIQVYAIVLEFGPGESSDRADWHPSLPCLILKETE